MNLKIEYIGAHPLTKCNPIDNQINSNWNAYKWQGINIFYVEQNVKKILFLPYDTTFLCIIDVSFLLQNKEVLRKYIKSLQHILRIPHTHTYSEQTLSLTDRLQETCENHSYCTQHNENQLVKV